MSIAVAQKQTARPLLRVVVGVFVSLLCAFGALSSGAAPAFAHAELLETTPADGAVLSEAPSSVELRFNEQVRLVEGATRLFLGDGSEVPLDAHVVNTTLTAALPEGLADGSYAFSYRVVSADGHPVGGALTFQVGEGNAAAPLPTGATTPGDPPVTTALVSALQGAQYLGLLLFAGLMFFERFVVRGHAPAQRPAGRIDRGVLRGALATAIGASLLLMPFSGARVSGAELVTYHADTGDLAFAPVSAWASGVTWQLAVAAGLVTAFGLAALWLRARAVLGGSAAVLAALAALAAPLFVGHTQTVQPGWAMLLADVGHLIAGAYWFGGVVGLVLFLRRDHSDAAAHVVARFSRWALVSVLVLGASGLVMGWLIVGSWSTLFTSSYGHLLLIKLGIVAVIILLAALNRLVFLPRISRLEGEGARWIGLRRTLVWEAALLVAVLGVTGFLTNTSPSGESGVTGASPNSTHQHGAHQHGGHQHSGLQDGVHQHGGHQHGDAAQGEPVHAESQGLTVDGTLTPGAVGSNTLVFRLEHNGVPVAQTAEGGPTIVVEARLPAQQLGPFSAEPEFIPETGEYRAELTLPVAGDWQVQVRVRIDTYSEPIAVIPVEIR